MPVAEIMELLGKWIVSGVQEAKMQQSMASWSVQLRPMREKIRESTVSFLIRNTLVPDGRLLYKTRSCVPFPYLILWAWKTRTLAPYKKQLTVPSARVMEFNRLLLAVDLYGDQLVRLKRTRDEFPRLHPPSADHPDCQPVLNLLGQFCFTTMIYFSGEDDALWPAYECKDSKSYLQALEASSDSFSRHCSIRYGKEDSFHLECEAPDSDRSFILTRGSSEAKFRSGARRMKSSEER